MIILTYVHFEDSLGREVKFFAKEGELIVNCHSDADAHDSGFGEELECRLKPDQVRHLYEFLGRMLAEIDSNAPQLPQM